MTSHIIQHTAAPPEEDVLELAMKLAAALGPEDFEDLDVDDPSGSLPPVHVATGTGPGSSFSGGAGSPPNRSNPGSASRRSSTNVITKPQDYASEVQPALLALQLSGSHPSIDGLASSGGSSVHAGVAPGLLNASSPGSSAPLLPGPVSPAGDMGAIEATSASLSGSGLVSAEDAQARNEQTLLQFAQMLGMQGGGWGRGGGRGHAKPNRPQGASNMPGAGRPLMTNIHPNGHQQAFYPGQVSGHYAPGPAPLPQNSFYPPPPLTSQEQQARFRDLQQHYAAMLQTQAQTQAQVQPKQPPGPPGPGPF